MHLEITLKDLATNNPTYKQLVETFDQKIETVSAFIEKKEFIKDEISRIRNYYLQSPEVKIIGGDFKMVSSFNFAEYAKHGYEWLSSGMNYEIAKIIQGAKQGTNYKITDESQFAKSITDNLRRGIGFLQYEQFLKRQLNIDPTQLNYVAESSIVDLIQKGENSFLEFKSTLRINIKAENIVDKKIEHSALKNLAAFLNSEGGVLLIGIEDNKNILGLELDLNSFDKPDKLDEFKKHLDNLISKTLGDRFHRYLKVDFPTVNGMMICSILIKHRSDEPVYFKNENGIEAFYIRRQASSIDLKLSDAVKYITEHWKF